jgi:hypothetical protein
VPKLRSVVTVKPSSYRISIQAVQQPQFGSFRTWSAGELWDRPAVGAIAAKLAAEAIMARGVSIIGVSFQVVAAA